MKAYFFIEAGEGAGEKIPGAGQKWTGSATLCTISLAVKNQYFSYKKGILINNGVCIGCICKFVWHMNIIKNLSKKASCFGKNGPITVPKMLDKSAT